MNKFWTIFCIIISLLVIIIGSSKNLTLDETFFAESWAVMVSEGGTHILSWEDETPSEKKKYTNYTYENYHPPLWRIIGYHWSSLFGTSDVSLRLFGTAFFLLGLGLSILYLHSRKIVPDNILFFLMLVIVNPYLIINHQSLHIDTHILFPITILYLLSLQTPLLLLHTSAIALGAFGKEILGGLLGITYFLQNRDKLVQATLIPVLAVPLFAGVWYIFSQIYTIPFEGWFVETIVAKVLHGEMNSSTSIISYLFLTTTRLIWKIIAYNIYIIPLFLITLSQDKNKKYDPKIMFIAVSSLFFIFYFYMNLYYLFTTIIILLMYISIRMKVQWPKYTNKLLLASTSYYLFFGYPLIKFQELWVKMQYGNTSFTPYILYGMLYILPLLVCTGVAYYKKLNLNNVKMMFIILYIGCSLGSNIHALNPNITTATLWNNIGEEGLQDTINFVDKNIKNNTTIITRKDINYYLLSTFEEKNITYVYNKFLRTSNEISVLSNFTKHNSGDIQFITTDMYTNDKLIPEDYTVVFKSGDFTVYENSLFED